MTSRLAMIGAAAGYMVSGIRAMRRDAWENVILGMTGAKDPSAYTTIVPRADIPDVQLGILFKEDPFAAKVVSEIVTESINGGWDLAVPGNPQDAAVLRDAYRLHEEEVGVAAAMREAAWWGRLYGGGVSWLGADDGADPVLPLDEEAIASFRWIHTFDRTEAIVHSYYQDASSAKFGRPEVYRLQPMLAARAAPFGSGLSIMGTTGPQIAGGILVHESRLVIWPGQPTTRDRYLVRGGWDDSVLERAYEALRQSAEDNAAKSATLGKLSQAVYKIKGLYDMIAGKRLDILAERMNQLDTSRSRANGIVLDTDEDFITHQQSLSGIDAAIEMGDARVAGATDLPLYKLTGRAPENAGVPGQTEEDRWLRTCEGWQDAILRPAHEKIARLVLLSADGPTGGVEPDDWSIKYRPLRKPPPAEKSAIRKTNAETAAIYIDKGVYPPEAVALAVATPTGTGEVQLDPQELEAALLRRRELAKQPPKDNAELGTVSARMGAAADLIDRVNQGKLSRESALAMLVQFARLNEADAEAMLGPKDFLPTPEPPKGGPPGPPPAPPKGTGAGAPQGLPGVDDGGAREPGEKSVPKGQGGTGADGT